MIFLRPWLVYISTFLHLDSAWVKEDQAQGAKSGGVISDSCYASNLTTCRAAKTFFVSLWTLMMLMLIHGLNPTNIKSHAEATWTSGDKMWLRDFLPEQLPNARVLLFGYNSNVAFETSIAGVREQAMNLLNRLDSKRENFSGRPIIFVAHSLGGIIVKRALVEAKNDDSYKSIREATYGIAFFGTPHQGGDLANLGDIAASIVREVFLNPNNDFMETLKKDSLFSTSFSNDFRHQLEDYHILSFYETRPMGKLGLIVDQKSATIGLAGKRERQMPLDAHHGEICRFDSADADDYEQVSFNLVRLVKDAIRASEYQQTKINAHEKPAFIVPYSKNHDFVGRQEILQTLQKDLKIGTNRQKRVALYGLGGVGKSQIAISFLFWHRKTYPNVSIFWIHSSTIDRFREGYTAIARDRKLPGFDDPNADHLNIVRSWLSSKASGKWLMIIDNSDEDDLMFGVEGLQSIPETVLMDQYIPTSAHGAVLMTTRNRIVAQKFTRGGSIIEITFLDKASAVKLFYNSFQGKELPASSVEDLVVQELECLPLAIVQAAACIQQSSMTIQGYLKYVRKSEDVMVAFLKQDFKADGRDRLLPNAITTTWIVSFEHISKTNPKAAEILQSTVCLDRRNIPTSLFTQGEDELGTIRALGLLDAFSFIKMNEEEGTFTMHKLVHVTVRGWLKQQDQFEASAIKCFRMVAENFPTDLIQSLQSIVTCDRYLPHGRTAIDSAIYLPQSDITIPQLSFKVFECLHLRGEYEVAAQVFDGVLQWYTRELGEKHPYTITKISELAVRRFFQGELEDAERITREVLELCAKSSEVHPGFTRFESFRAFLLGRLGRYHEAEEISRRHVTQNRKNNDEKLQVQFYDMNVLLSILAPQEQKAVEAEELAREALALSETFEADPETLLHLEETLANILKLQAKYKEAESWILKVVASAEKLFGPEHSRTLRVLANHAVLLYEVGDYKSSEQILRRVVSIGERVLSATHPDTLRIFYHFATSLHTIGNFEESSQMYQRACSGMEIRLGSQNSEAITCADGYRQLLKVMESREEESL